jgi:malate dehydrogenase (oxaloacetate-decarboxylating)
VVLPPLTALAELSKAIAFAVAKVAQAEGLASERSDDELRGDIERNFWTPQYREYRRIAARAR